MSKKQSTFESTAKRTCRNRSDEYKIEAVKMVAEQDDKVAGVARSLGINVNQLHRWIRQFSEQEEIPRTKNSNVCKQKINACEWSMTS